jgi:hypothetical protein
MDESHFLNANSASNHDLRSLPKGGPYEGNKADRREPFLHKAHPEAETERLTETLN